MKIKALLLLATVMSLAALAQQNALVIQQQVSGTATYPIATGLPIAGYTNHTLTWSQVGTTTATGTIQIDCSPTGTGSWTSGGLISSQSITTHPNYTVTVTSEACSYAQINYAVTAGTIKFTYSAVNGALSKGGGSGGSVSITAGNGITLSPNPLTGSGSVAISNNTANTLAGFDNSGAPGDVTIGTGLALSGGVLSASGSISGSGTTNTLPLWSGTTALGNSNESEAGGIFVIGTSGGWKTTGSGPSLWSGTVSPGLTVTVPGFADFSAFEGSDALFHCQTSGAANCLGFSAIGGAVDLTSQVTNILPAANGGMTPPATNGDIPCAITSGTVWGLLTGNTSGTKVLQEDASGNCSWASAGAGTVTSIATTSPITGGTITSIGTIACATCVTSSSPGAGIAHFAGSTQAVTSSSIVGSDITNATITGTQIANTTVANANLVNAATTVNGVTCTLGSTCAPTSRTSGTSIAATAPFQLIRCTSTCTVTIPVPPAEPAVYQFCIYNADNVATVITLAAIGSSVQYENTARTAFGTAGTGTFVSGGAVADAVCIVSADTTHYNTLNYTGTWTAN